MTGIYSACRKSLFASLNKLSELYKSFENLGFQWRRTPFLGFHRTPSLTVAVIYRFIDALIYDQGVDELTGMGIR